MKKLFLAILLFLSMNSIAFANSVNIDEGTIEKDKISSVVLDKKDKIYFITVLYKLDAENVNKNKLNKVKNEIINITCNDEELKNMVDNGYKIITEFIYTNNVFVRVVVDNCSM